MDEQRDARAYPIQRDGALPAVLTSRAAVAAGVRAELRTGYRPAARGVHVAHGVDVTEPDVRIAVAMAAAPPTVTLGGWAAARLLEQRAVARGRRSVRSRTGTADTVFDGRPAAGTDRQPVLLLAPPEVRMTAGPGRRLLRSRVETDERWLRDGIWVTTPLRTAFDLARLGPPLDAVIGLDRLRALGLVTGGDIADLLDRRCRWRGARAGRHAVLLSRDGVESPQETRLRLLWVDAGLPDPGCNVVLVDGGGAFLAWVDLLDRGSGLVGEYDGAVHASATDRSRDAARQERLERNGLVVIRATAADLATPRSRRSWQHRARAAWRRAQARRTHAEWRVLPDTPGVSRQNSPLG